MLDVAFESKVRKLFRRGGWVTQENVRVSFAARRELFEVQVLLGTELYDRRFPVVDQIYTGKVAAIKAWIAVPNIVIFVRDRDTMRHYQQLNIANVSVLHWDDRCFIEGLSVDVLVEATSDSGPSAWAIKLSAMNPSLCRRLSQHAGTLDLLTSSRFWAERAVAVGGHDPLNHYELAGVLLRCGNIEKAAEAMGAALNLMPDSAMFFSRASRIASRQGFPAEALALAKQATQANDRRPADFHLLATLYLKSDESGQATMAAEWGLALDNKNRDLQEIITRLK